MGCNCGAKPKSSPTSTPYKSTPVVKPPHGCSNIGSVQGRKCDRGCRTPTFGLSTTYCKYKLCSNRPLNVSFCKY